MGTFMGTAKDKNDIDIFSPWRKANQSRV